MNQDEYKILKQAVKIMNKEAKRFGKCKEFAFNCGCCEVAELAKRFDSFVNFWLDPCEK